MVLLIQYVVRRAASFRREPRYSERGVCSGMANPFGYGGLRAVRTLEPQFRSAFPVVQEQQSLTVQIDTRKAKYHKPKPQPAQLGGVQFLNPAQSAGQFSRMIQVQRENCVVVVNEYSRWDTVWPRVQGWVQTILNLVLSGRPLSSVMLQYNDVFTWREEPSLLNPAEVFLNDSPFLPSNCLHLRTPCTLIMALSSKWMVPGPRNCWTTLM